MMVLTRCSALIKLGDQGNYEILILILLCFLSPKGSTNLINKWEGFSGRAPMVETFTACRRPWAQFPPPPPKKKASWAEDIAVLAYVSRM